MSDSNKKNKASEEDSKQLSTPPQTKRPRPSLKPPNSARSAQKKRQSVKFADTADIRLIYQRAAAQSPSDANGTTSSPDKYASCKHLIYYDLFIIIVICGF